MRLRLDPRSDSHRSITSTSSSWDLSPRPLRPHEVGTLRRDPWSRASCVGSSFTWLISSTRTRSKSVAARARRSSGPASARQRRPSDAGRLHVVQPVSELVNCHRPCPDRFGESSAGNAGAGNARRGVTRRCHRVGPQRMTNGRTHEVARYHAEFSTWPSVADSGGSGGCYDFLT